MDERSIGPQLLAQSILLASPLAALRPLKVQQTRQALVLTGTVASYYFKQLAQEAVRPAAGKLEVVNRVCVRRALGRRALVTLRSR